MRARLYREGVVTTDGRLLESTVWPVTVPLLTYQDRGLGHDGATIVGVVTDIRRDEGGWVTGDLDAEIDVTGLVCEADFTTYQTPAELDEFLAVMRNARLGAVTVGMRPCWPDMEITP